MKFFNVYNRIKFLEQRILTPKCPADVSSGILCFCYLGRNDINVLSVNKR